MRSVPREPRQRIQSASYLTAAGGRGAVRPSGRTSWQRSMARRREVSAVGDIALCSDTSLAVNPVPFGRKRRLLSRRARRCRAVRSVPAATSTGRQAARGGPSGGSSRARHRPLDGVPLRGAKEWRRVVAVAKPLADPVQAGDRVGVPCGNVRGTSSGARCEAAGECRLCAICAVNPVPFGPGVRRVLSSCVQGSSGNGRRGAVNYRVGVSWLCTACPPQKV